MEELSTPTWYQLALQIPLALVIVFLVIRFLAFVKEIIQAFLQSLKEQDINNREFISQQQDLNRIFIASQQEHTNAAISRLAEELKANKVDTLKELSNLTQRIDNIIEKSMLYEKIFSMQNKSASKKE